MREDKITTVYDTQHEVVNITCDLCGKVCPHPNDTYYLSPITKWATDGCDILSNNEVTVSMTLKTDSSDLDNEPETISLDVCPQCFRDKIMSLVIKKEN
jgi:hypothetical protein